MSKWCHQIHEVEFHECDLGRGVHNSVYFTWFERARFQIAKDAGLMDYIMLDNTADIVSNDFKKNSEVIIFPVLEAECKYIHTIHMGAKVIIRTKLERPKVARLVFHHVVTDAKTGEDYCIGKTTVGVVSSTRGLMMNLDGDIKVLIDQYLNM